MSKRVTKDGIPIDVELNDKTVQVGTGSYSNGHGLTITVSTDYLVEVTGEEMAEEVQACLKVARDALVGEIQEDDE